MLHEGFAGTIGATCQVNCQRAWLDPKMWMMADALVKKKSFGNDYG